MKPFWIGFEKTAAKPPFHLRAKWKAESVGRHLKKHHRDYAAGGTAVGALGTAYGVNKKKNS
jgi:hypothetical protein